MTSHLDEWHVLSSRYGFATRYDAPGWAQRHRVPNDEPHRCVCPGGQAADNSCALRATQEDMLCDECRQWCIASDGQGNVCQLASVQR